MFGAPKTQETPNDMLKAAGLGLGAMASIGVGLGLTFGVPGGAIAGLPLVASGGVMMFKAGEAFLRTPTGQGLIALARQSMGMDARSAESTASVGAGIDPKAGAESDAKVAGLSQRGGKLTPSAPAFDLRSSTARSPRAASPSAASPRTASPRTASPSAVASQGRALSP